MLKTEMNIKKELFNKKFKNDSVFQFISKEYVTLNDDEKTTNNNILQIILTELVVVMADCDNLFKKMSRGCMYGGSYYKRLKVTGADEYDINLIMKLPINYINLKKETKNCKSGYIKIKVANRRCLNKSDTDIWSSFLDDDEYLDQNKFRNWMHSVVVKSLNKYTTNGNVVNLDGKLFTITYRQNNPAFKLLIMRDDGVKFEVDLVPCLIFQDKKLPGFTDHQANTWITIAKPLSEEIRDSNLLWRVGFYKDEKKMVEGQIKPIIRMMKVFRDRRNWTDIKSYYIETFFLHELQNREFLELHDKASRTCLFIYMLKRFEEVLRSEKIVNYWHEDHNLLENIRKERLECITNELRGVIYKIEDNAENILRYFATDVSSDDE